MCGRLQDAGDLVLALPDPVLDHDRRRRGTAFAIAGDTGACDALRDFIKKCKAKASAAPRSCARQRAQAGALSHYTT
jgi:hypothetical protein